jgi:hypothetical protein
MLREKIDKSFTVLLKKSQKDKLELIKFYSGKSMGTILRMFIDKIDAENWKKEKLI